MKWWLVFAGGGVGSALRYAVGLWVQSRTGSAFPWGTFAVNAIGCLLIGVIATLADEHAWIAPSTRLLLVTGLLGGFTTFSSFTFESFELLRSGQFVAASANVLGQIAFGLLALWAGFAVGRAV